MTAPLRLLVTLIAAMFLIGLATLVSGVLVLAIPLIVYWLAAVALRPETVSVRLTHNFMPDHAPHGAPVLVKLHVLNEGPAVGELAVRDALPDGVTVRDGYGFTTVHGVRYIALELAYTVTARRGEYSDYQTVVCGRDVFGLFEYKLAQRTMPPLVVHPHYPKLDRIKIRPPQTRGFAGPIAARRGGTGSNFWGVREYQANDPQGQINWRLSARSERDLYTNIYEQERVADVGLILDARECTNVVTASGPLFEHSVRAAAALAENFLDDGNRVSLLVYGPGLERVYPGYGRVHRIRILNELSKAEPRANYALESLSHLPTRLFPARSQLVMISPLLPEDIPALVRMRVHGYAVIVVSPDPVFYESLDLGQTDSPAYRIANGERTLMLRQMRQCGAQIVNWRVNTPLELAIREALANQPVQRMRV